MIHASVDNGRRVISREQRVLALDLGSTMGWAVLDARGARLASGVHVFRPRQHAGRRWREARIVLSELLAEHRPALLAYEDVVRHAAGGRPNYRAAQVYGAFAALTTLAAFEFNPELPIAAVPVGVPKMRATKKANAKKDEMVAAAVWRWSVPITDDNEADALWIAWVALQGEGHAPGAGHGRGVERSPLETGGPC